MFEQKYEQLQLDQEFPFAMFTTSDKQAFFHYHDCLELNIVERGEGNYIINGKKYPILPGDIFVINNKEPHMAVHGTDFSLTALVFDIQLLWRNKGLRQFLMPFLSRSEGFSHRIANDNLYYMKMKQLFAEIAAEYQKKEIGWRTAAESLLTYLLTLIYRYYQQRQGLDERNEDFHKEFMRICAVLEYIGDHFKEKITLEQLSRLVCLSPHYLCKCFRKITGKTIFEYIEQMRIQYSCYLLPSTDKSIMEIALESGFNSVSYYNRIFRKYMELTPRQYRQRAAAATDECLRLENR